MSGSSSSICTYNGISGASTVSFNRDNTSKYTIKFDGKRIETTVTDKATIVDQWVQDINVLYEVNSSVIVALDIKWKPTRVQYLSNKSATLHLCIDDKCLILQLFHVGNLPISLKNFLMNPNFFFVGVEVSQKISKINDEYGLNCGGVHADVKELAMEKWPGRYLQLILKDLAKDVLGLSIKNPKLVSLSNWEVRVLSIEQVEYVCIDAYVSYKIGQMLLRDE
ncbi:Werner Syndrome-like exonuclease [Arachis ipaensis]|uniref:Werner Syndrome-like exonuclease n=1 Tax=Arachis ipaensis TaxID=130454 RepID=UPI0007AF19C3|nr:Werner Syndrome-like exonuclease [Arachis ipaensis]